MARLAICLALVLVCNCSHGVKPMPPESLPICTTAAECDAHDGERIEVVGTYSVWDPRAGITSERTRSQHVIVKLPDTPGGPFLEAGSDRRHNRALDEIERFRDKRVRVVGRFVQWMPQRDDDSAQLGGACISDIESITLVE